jgi:glycerol uptake operon antiterminator
MTLLHVIGKKPVIAAVRKMADLNKALDSEVDNVFFMGGNAAEMIQAVRSTHESGKHAFIHLDLIRGLSSTDKETIDMVTQYIGARGIVTPKSHMVKVAKQAGLFGILHLFVIDTLAVENGLKLAESVEPDCIELMPGVIPKVIERFATANEHIPVIASGLIHTMEEAKMALNAGATSLSVTEASLWSKSFEDILQ